MNLRYFTVLLLLSISSPAFSADAGATSQVLEFEVFLDDKPIGYHNFDIGVVGDGSSVVKSEARFDVKFLFFSAYKYRHENTERWYDGCLAEIDSETNTNGKQASVSGVRTENGFSVQSATNSTEHGGCVMTFAYWNPEFLKQEKLLNPQTGEYLDVAIIERAPEMLSIGGEEILATPYSIRAHEMELIVWYSSDSKWLALESLAKGGRTIRYELT